MPRTTPDLVQTIVRTRSADDLTGFIETANSMVTDLCGGLYDDAKLELIERWLAAHLYKLDYNRSTVAEQIGQARKQYNMLNNMTSQDMKSTPYGRMAMSLDYKGGLARLDNWINATTKRMVGATYLGTPPCEDQT